MTASRYCKVNTKKEKTNLVRSLQFDMERSGYRFLRFEPSTFNWVEADHETIRSKVSHALRDSVRASRKRFGSRNSFSGQAITESTDAVEPIRISLNCWSAATTKEHTDDVPLSPSALPKKNDLESIEKSGGEGKSSNGEYKSLRDRAKELSASVAVMFSECPQSPIAIEEFSLSSSVSLSCFEEQEEESLKGDDLLSCASTFDVETTDEWDQLFEL
eukprot:CAMPEP_0202447164 /NCGR_PEP_ID=MMETSP1360-20130828/5847_1 /ASSEMBLY_ACC=CAM_ASM_000848 /TAXON_ID=515479 /ORGANISM="Licmophora paradoxa, Strain CCMP2313" /LENGTH=216 /DNA_ID=CAMNT_0049064085 /DNA_START=223 /DNA_END=873 /DNA_ORIENTATION=+